MIRIIFLWLVLLRNWFYMKPFCYGSSVNQDKQRYTYVGINFPRGWFFLHFYVVRDKNNFNLHVTRTKSSR